MLPQDLITHPTFLLTITVILGLIIGSFLNVVMYRFPIMLMRDWRDQCNEFLKTHPAEKNTQTPLNLCLPLSHCPQCKHPLALWFNIPIISYLFLRGKCHYCHAPISWHYPFIEFVTTCLTILVILYFGYTWQALGALLFTWSLLVLTDIDIRHQLLPDAITLSLLWLGLFCNLFHLFVPLNEAVIGALAGYLSLWVVAQGFKLCTGKDGMGHGDFKLFAALGAWLGWTQLPLILLFASFLGALIGIIFVCLKFHERSQPIPFGPFLALGGLVALFCGDQLLHGYLSWFAG
jgi:leader peptidase (prepilin peptidase)/N-methyltransferase